MENQITVITPQQILLPKKVYIGDTAELRCTFNSGDVTFVQLTQDGTAHITTEAFTIPLDSRDFEILDVTLSPAGVNYYQLSVSFKSWKTGDIVFPPLKLRNNQIDFLPVNIVSITEQDNSASLKDTAAPLLLPGTTYKLYGTLVVLVILLITAIRLIVKRKSVMLFINNRRLLRKYKKNRRQTIKNLNNIRKMQDNRETWAESLEHIIRKYLEIRFDYPFTKTVTSDLMKGFYAATNNVFSEAKEEAAGEIAAVFIRLDFLRYSKNADFTESEKIELIERLIVQIEKIEMGE